MKQRLTIRTNPVLKLVALVAVSLSALAHGFMQSNFAERAIKTESFEKPWQQTILRDVAWGSHALLLQPANTITVNTTAQTGSGCTLGNAIQAANSNTAVGGCAAGAAGSDTIILPAGTYTLTAIDNIESNFNTANGLPTIESPITIQGTSAGSTIIERSSAVGTPEFRFFQLGGSGQLTLNDVTLKNGRTTPFGAGAILPFNTLTINNCRFENNSTGGGGAGGGAIGSSFGYSAIINNSTFTGNNSGGSGGAIANATELTVTNSTFTNNSAANAGGAITLGNGSTGTITGSTFTNNTVTNQGGGGAVNGHTVNISTSTFDGNSVAFNGGEVRGGAVYARFITVDRSVFINNTSGGSGGAIANVSTSGAFLTIANSTISGNTANHGGGVFGANTTLTNSTVSGNFARESGGGVVFNGSDNSLSLNNVTITNNRADSDNNGSGRSGGLFHTYSFAASQSMNIRNTIIAGNINSNTPDCGTEFGHATLSQGYNLIGNNTGCNFTAATGDQVGNSSTPINAQLGALANRGGSGQMHALLPNSPALDSANPNPPDGTGNKCMATDQRGAPRPADGDGNGSSRCDIGAFEVVQLHATNLAFQVQPTSRTAGQVFSPPPQVEVRDQFGIVMTEATIDITISLANNAGGSTLSGSLTRTTVGGIATFDDVFLNRTGTGYTLQASASGVPFTVSNAFSISAGNAAQLAFAIHPANANALAIMPTIAVAVQDPFGNVKTNATNTVTLAIQVNGGAGTLSGTLTRSSSTGIASFNDLSINNPASGYTLRATAPGLTEALSNSFEITRATLVVTKTADTDDDRCDVDCSLREAIRSANRISGADVINFNISGSGPFAIMLITLLPSITSPVTIDGTSQPGYSGLPIVGINGSGFQSPFTSGFDISQNAGGSTIRGLLISGFTGNNGYGILVRGNGNVIKGNFIGTDFAGGSSIANRIGIRVNGANNIIGGTTPADRNVISGNSFAAIALYFESGNLIQGNYIGRNAGNTSNLGNSCGVFLRESASNTIGGAAAGAGNVIASNDVGVEIDWNTANQTAIRNQIRGNSIYGNAQKGISLSYNKPTRNDPGDRDTGPNKLQNYPVLNLALSNGGTTNIRGTINSERNQTYTLEFFSNQTCSASGEGSTPLGTVPVTTDNTGIADFNVNLAATIAAGQFITATATDADGNTSEFSDCEPVGDGASTISGRVVGSNNNPIPSTLVKLLGTRTQTTTTDRNGNYSFANLPIGDYAVQPSQQMYSFSPPSRAYLNLVVDHPNQDFVGTRNRYEITAVVKTNRSGSLFPLREVNLTVSSGANLTRQTDANGRTFFVLQPSASYILTPNFGEYAFTPGSVTLPSPLTSDMTIEFIAQPPAPIAGRLVFRSSYGIAALNADGSGFANLPLGNSFLSASSDLSRDGSSLVVSNPDIWAANHDGSSLTNLLDINVPLTSPRWSEDKTKIAFDKNSPSNEQGIHIFDVVDSTIFNLISNGFNPSWSPDGGRLTFHRRLSATNLSIYSVNANGTDLKPLTSQFDDRYPDWSPDGSKIVFIRKISATSCAIRTMNTNGNNQTAIFTSNSKLLNPKWSPDGSRIAFLEEVEDGVWSNTYKLSVIKADGSGRVDLSSAIYYPSLSWGAEYQVATPSGAGVAVQSGGVSLNFAGVSNDGQTTATPISPNSAGTAPGGFAIGNLAYEISTTATYTAPISVCFTVPATTASTNEQFIALNLMHNENGVLVNRTTSRNLISRQICGSVNSLSPFALAEQIDLSKPQISGLVLDSIGNPMSGVRMHLTGTETKETETNTNGTFSFVNLTAGENYNVQPKQLGYFFNEYSQDFVNVSGETTVVFTGTPNSFSIGGRVTDANGNGVGNVLIQLEGASGTEATTDANGNYSFPGLPADGSYSVSAFDGAHQFDPSDTSIGPLVSNVSAIDFTVGAPIPIPPSFAISDVSQVETNSGTTAFTFTVTKTAANGLPSTVSFSTQNGTATISDTDYVASAGTLNFAATDTSLPITVTVNGDTVFETDETFKVVIVGDSNAAISDAEGVGTILNDDAQPTPNVVQFSASNYNVHEDCTTVTITVDRVGDTSGPASVDYNTSNVTASEKSDYITALGRLQFAVGESSKSFVVLINEDSLIEGNETFTASLTNSLGVTLGGSIATVTIADDAVEPTTNVIDDPRNFVCQQYHDFLNRQPDQAGWDFWTNQITSCGNEQQCIEIKRVNVSAAFFLSIEFQQTAYLVERTYKAAYGDATGSSSTGGMHQLPVPIVRYAELLQDTQAIGKGVIVGTPDWEMVVEINKLAFAAEFVQRARFITALPTSLTPTQFVNQMFTNASVTPTDNDRSATIAEFGAAVNTNDIAARARALRRVTENSILAQQEFNRAFVLMEYFGYLRRNPNDPRDTDYSGFEFWLNKLNQFNGNFIGAEMVKAFITSIEYRQRFGLQ